MRIEKLKEKFELRVAFTHFPLHPDTPEEGQTLEEMFAGRNMDIPAMKARMKALMAEEGLPYGDRDSTYNSRLAQELGKWAEGQPGGEAIHDALFRAFFVDLVNLAKLDKLVEIAGKVGLDEAEARRVLEERTFREAVDADWKRSMEMGVTGVPTFVANGVGVVGAQPYEALEQLVQKAGAIPRNGGK